MPNKQGRPRLYGEPLKTLQVGVPLSVYHWIEEQARSVHSTVAATTRALVMDAVQEAMNGRTEPEPAQD